MRPGAHKPADIGESFEISLLAGDQRICLEERNDALDQIVEAAHFVLERLVASIRPNTAASKVLLHQQEHFTAISILTDREARSDFPADQQFAARRKRDRKTTLSVNESSKIS
jgi:hypothetical protein